MICAVLCILCICSSMLATQEKPLYSRPLSFREALSDDPTLSRIIATQVANARRQRALKEVFEQNIPFTVAVNGLFRTAAYYDTRQVFGELDNYEMFLPAAQALDANGIDVNKRGQQNIVPSDSRFILSVLGPEINCATSWGLLEADFLGVGNSIDFDIEDEVFAESAIISPILTRLLRNQIANRFNIRRLFFKLDWEGYSILVGQEYHPFVFIKAPEVLSYNTGAPFGADSRSAQLRISMRSEHLEMILTAVSERQFLHSGPLGPASEYYRDSLTPILNAQLRYYFDGHMIAAGMNYIRLTPRLLTNVMFGSPVDENFRDYSSLSSICATTYGEFHFRHFEFYAKLNYLENGANFQMLSGYAVHSRDPETDRRTYTNLRAVTAWGEFVITKTIEPALFFAYGKNLGARETIITSRFVENDLVYALFPDVDQAWRISPRIRWHNEPIVIGFEMEYTGAIYGDLDDFGKIINQQPPVHNIRFLAMFDYYF